MEQINNTSKREIGFSYVGKYKIIQQLGKGGTAKVKLAINTETNKKVALKIFRPPSQSQMKIKISKNSIIKEFDLIEGLQHENLINVIEIIENGIYEKKNGSQYETIVIVLEFAAGGECFDYVAQFKGFSENVSRSYFKQLILGIQFLHNKGIAHRDLKMENILFDNNYVLKIADFGFAKLLEGDKQDGILKTRLGTQGYQAPEISNGKGYKGEPVDIFACGVILFLFICGRPPFEEADKDNKWYQTFLQKKDKFWAFQRKYNNIPDDLCFLIDNMLTYNPEKRYTLEQILANHWMEGKILDQDEIKKEMETKNFILNKKLQEQKVQAQLKKKKQQENQNDKRQQKFRSVLDQQDIETFNDIEAIYKEKLKNERKLKKANFVGIGDIISFEPAKLLFNRLLQILNEECREIPAISDQFYKIKCLKCVGQNDEQEIKYQVQLLEIDENQTKVLFIKEEGNYLSYYSIINTIIEKLGDNVLCLKNIQNEKNEQIQKE